MADPVTMIEDIRDAASVGQKNGGINLSEYEEEFVDSIEDQLNDDRTLTDKQHDVLTGIWDRI